jgi:amino acid adenylation domain-containing protein
VSTLADVVSAHSQRRPDAVAVVCGARRITYGELEAVSNRFAYLLLERGLRPGDRVCLFLPKGPEAIAAMLGVLKARGVYVPIDLAGPAPRVAKIVRACEPSIVVADPEARELVAGLDARDVVPLGPRTRLDDLPRTRPPLRASPSDAAHILFTSGSTGTPKGVVITHANVLHFLGWAVPHFGIAPGDRVSCHAPLHFDLSTFDVYGTLSAGAELHLVPPDANLRAHGLAEFIRSSQVTQWFSVPSVLAFLAKHDAVLHWDFPSLRRVLWCGEVLPTPVLAHWMRCVPHATFTNLYGPTEATIASSHYTIPCCPQDDREPIPIGIPIPGERLFVLDRDLREVPEGETGDLYIQGPGLSPGYWRDPERTREAFLPSPFDPGERLYRTGDLACTRRGLFHFVGRNDSQVKSRGYRIELGEIEAALNAVPGLRECAVVAVATNGFEGAAICCAYVGGPPPERVRSELARQVPSYMLPTRWRVYESLPRTANGKTDRRRLQEEFVRGPP